MGPPAQCGEDTENEDGERQGAARADIVGEVSETEAADRPAEQTDGAEDAADPADIRDAGISAQELRQGWPQHERKQTEIRRIERPAGPRDKEHQPLVPGNPPHKAHWSTDAFDCADCPHSSLPLLTWVTSRPSYPAFS